MRVVYGVRLRVGKYGEWLAKDAVACIVVCCIAENAENSRVSCVVWVRSFAWACSVGFDMV